MKMFLMFSFLASRLWKHWEFIGDEGTSYHGADELMFPALYRCPYSPYSLAIEIISFYRKTQDCRAPYLAGESDHWIAPVPEIIL